MKIKFCLLLPVLLSLFCSASAQTNAAGEYYQIALSLKLDGNFQGAYLAIMKADSLLGDTQDETPELPAKIAYLHGILSYNLNQFQEAFNALQLADSLFAVTNNIGGRADAHLFMGNSVWYTAGGLAALPYFDAAIFFAENDLKNQRTLRGKYYLDKGYALAESGNFQESFKWVNKGIEIDLLYYGPVSEAYAQALMVSAIAHKFVGDYYVSAVTIEQALTVLQKAGKTNDASVAPLYGNLANIYFNMADFEESEHYTYKALEAFGNLLPEGNYNSVTLHINLGNIYVNRNQPEKGLEWFERAAPYIDQSSGADLYHSLQYGIALCLQALGKSVEADSIYRATEQSMLDANGFFNVNTATHYINFANNLMGLDSLGPAIVALDKAETIQTKLFGASHIMLSEIKALKGNFYWKKEQLNLALQYAEEGLQFFEALSEDRILDFRSNFCALHYLRARCLKTANGIGTEQQLSKALDSYRSVESLFNYELTTERNMEDRQSFIEERNNLYREMMSAAYKLHETQKNYKEDMWRMVEKSKAFILLDGVRRAQIPELEPVLDSIRKVSVAYNYYWKQLAINNEQDNPMMSIQWKNQAFTLEIHRRALWNTFRKNNPQLADYFDPNSQIVTLTGIRDSLLTSDQALLEYFVGDSSIYLFVVRPDTMIVKEVKRDFPLEDWIEGLRHGIYGYYAADRAIQTDSLKADAKRKYLEFAPKLYQKLFAPVAHHLPEKVILVPDGPLGYIPFDALLTATPEEENDFKSYPYLIHKHQFSYTYSATLLREMRDKKHRQEPQKDFVAFAPFYDGDTTLLAGMFTYDDLMRKDLKPLAFSGPEVAAASKLMHGETVAGAAATEERFTSMAGDYRIIHLATHGRADNRVGDYAFLAFTEIKDSIENELLYVKDLYNLSLNADLVVLSACETGIGKLQRGEGIISLARAFAYAGAKGIVTSLWSVSDKSTSELMRFFYRELKHRKDKDEALRLARLRFLKESTVKNSHPFFWAAFVPVGDMRGVK